MTQQQLILWMTPITDRTQSDVDRAKELLGKPWQDFTDSEKNEYESGLKGCLNTSDLDRILNNITLLDEVLELSLTISPLPEIPTESFFAEIIYNVNAIRNAYITYLTTPVTPDAPLNTFSKWNTIEQILKDVYSILLNNFNYYCDTEIYAGDDTGLLL